jgi:hypothetical protein
MLALITSGASDVPISDESHIYDSLDELRSHRGPRVPLLKIDFKNPYGSLDIGKRKARWFTYDKNALYVSNDQRESEYLYFKLRSFLQSHETILPRVFNLWGVMLLAVLLGIWRCRSRDGPSSGFLISSWKIMTTKSK